MVSDPSDPLENDALPLMESETLASSPPESESKPDTAAKWFVVAFLMVVPVLGFVLLGVICYSLWRAFFA